MSLRTYGPMKRSLGTVIPPQLRIEVLERDRGCVGAKFSETPCAGGLELDHVRASHGIGMKSRTEADNLVTLCGAHHREKTNNGRTIRPILLAYLATVTDPHDAHVDPAPGCPRCYWPVDFDRGAA